MTKVRSVEAIVLARSIAITMVVANHAGFGLNLHGGLNALLAISGLSLAQFGFAGTTADAIRAIARIGLRLAVPSFLLALVWQLGVGQISFPELGFYSNWLYKSRVALFPIWYAQALTQMLFGIAALFLATDMGARIVRRPAFWVSVLYAGTSVTAVISYNFWDSSYLADQLPHLILWNFVFGWMIWAFQSTMRPIQARLLLTLVLAVSIVTLFVSVDADHGMTRALVMPLIVLPVLWFDRIPLPEFIARFAIVASQSTLFIFLLHYYVFWAAWRAGRLFGFEQLAAHPVLRLMCGILVPIIVWSFWTAVVRVYRRGYRVWPANSIV